MPFSHTEFSLAWRVRLSSGPLRASGGFLRPGERPQFLQRWKAVPHFVGIGKTVVSHGKIYGCCSFVRRLPKMAIHFRLATNAVRDQVLLSHQSFELGPLFTAFLFFARRGRVVHEAANGLSVSLSPTVQKGE